LSLSASTKPLWHAPGRCFVIAEIGVNHNGALDLARQLIDVAAAAGADAVKFQTFAAERLVTATARKAAYQEANDPRKAESQFAMLKRLELSEADLVACRDHCTARGVMFLSTPFDEQSADLLASLGVHGFKVSSGDLTNLPFLAHMAAKRLPMIVSTGMGTLAEVAEAVEAVREAGDPPLALLHCVSNYPAAPEDCNLRAMGTLAQAFGVPVGWSDHTLGDAISLAAVALGARILEKHYTLDRGLQGPDHKASLTPEELTALITRLRAVESALGDGLKRPQEAERDTARVARRSLVAARDIAAGARLTAGDLIAKRPGEGIAPKHRELILGWRAARDIPADTVLSWTDLAP